MSERAPHYVAADLVESWLRDWIGAGLEELERYLVKQAAFVAYLAQRDAAGGEPSPAAG
jgi:hypothetical protein